MPDYDERYDRVVVVNNHLPRILEVLEEIRDRLGEAEVDE